VVVWQDEVGRQKWGIVDRLGSENDGREGSRVKGIHRRN